MKKYFLDKRTLVSGKKNYLNTSNFLSLKTYIDNLISTSTNNAVNNIDIYPVGTWQSFNNLNPNTGPQNQSVGNLSNRLLGHWIEVKNDIMVSEMAVKVVNGNVINNGNTVAGIYNTDPITGYPTTLIAQPSALFLNSVVITTQSSLFTTPVSLPKGLYFIASNRNNNNVWYAGFPTNLNYKTVSGAQIELFNNLYPTNVVGLEVPFVYSTTMPSLFPPGATTLHATTLPVISLRIA